MDRRTHEFCVLAELRDRLRAGDMRVEGSRRYRAVEQQPIPKSVFAAMRKAGPPPGSAAEWLGGRCEILACRLGEAAAKVGADALEEASLQAGRLRISPLKANTPDKADTDGGGVSDHVFAMRHGMGFVFAPRIPNLSARRLHLFEGLDPGPDIAPLVGEAIDGELIEAHWTDVLRLNPRPRAPGPEPPRERAQPGRGRNRAVEHDLPRSSHAAP